MDSFGGCNSCFDWCEYSHCPSSALICDRAVGRISGDMERWFTC